MSGGTFWGGGGTLYTMTPALFGGPLYWGPGANCPCCPPPVGGTVYSTYGNIAVTARNQYMLLQLLFIRID